MNKTPIQAHPGIYKNGYCDAMAIALHRVTGLPCGLISGVYMQEGEECLEDCHAVVIVDADSETYLDVDGINHGLPLENLYFSNNVTRVILRSATKQEVENAFSVSGVSESEIQGALQYIRTSALRDDCRRFNNPHRTTEPQRTTP